MKNNFVPLRLDLIFQMQGNEAYRCNHRYITLDNLFFWGIYSRGGPYSLLAILVGHDVERPLTQDSKTVNGI
jgi:hypothetical protein